MIEAGELENLLKRAAKKAKEAEIFVQEVSGVSCVAEKGILDDYKTGYDFGIGIRVNFKGKTGFAYGNSLKKFDDILRNAIKSAAVGDVFRGLPSGQAYGKIGETVDRKVESLSNEEIMRRAREMLSVLREKKVRPTYTGIDKSRYGHAVANTNGVLVFESATYISFGAYATVRKSVGWRSKSSRKDEIDHLKIARESADMAISCLNARKIETKGKMQVILKTECTAGDALLANTLVPAINGDNVFRKASKLAGRLGEQIFSENLNVFDDGTLKDGLNSWKADSEGTASRRTAVVEKGVLKNFLYDFETARRAGGGAESTANGFRGYSAEPSIAPSNLIIGKSNMSEEDLIREVKSGLVVDWLSGTHTANEFSGDFSVEAKNAFFIKNGRITYPVKSALVSGNIFEMLKNMQPADNPEQMGDIVAPSILCSLDVVG